MRKLLIAMMLLLIVFCGGVYWALNSPWLSTRLARRAIEGHLPGARVTELSAGDQRFSWPGQFVWKDVRIGMRYKDRTYQAVIPIQTVSGVETLARGQGRLNVVLTGAEISSSPGEARELRADLSLSFKDRVLVLIQGPASISKLKWDKLEAQQLSCQLSGGTKEITCGDLRATAYGGTLAGQVQIVFEGPTYSVDLSAQHLETSRLADLNEQFAEQVMGRATGHVRLAGRGENLSTLESDWSMLEGAKVNAALLSVLSQYIPQSQEKKRLDALIKKGGQLPVEILAFTIRSDTPQHLSADVKLKSREVNLELNLNNDINTDGTLLSLLDYWKTYFK